MPCPMCNHTMQNLGLAQSGKRTFWCPRCGTLKTEAGGEPEAFAEHESPRWTRLIAEGRPEEAFRELKASYPSVVAEKS